MSVFNDIAVLKRPAPEMKDWSFMLGELKFEVHDAEVELTSQLKSFEQFAGAMDKLDMLLDHIDQNDGKLEKAVFDLVNQNNELAMALGIIMPYSFATEEEQAQAAQDVKEAAGVDNAEGEEKGFFAKAWEGIKKFFRSIKEACVKAWNAITNRSKKDDERNNAANQALESMEPKEVQAALDNAFSKAGRVYITLEDALAMVKDIDTIAGYWAATSQSFGNPVEFFKFLDKYDGSFTSALGAVRTPLKNLGIELVEQNINGKKVSKVNKTGKSIYDITPEKLKTARDSFSQDNGGRAVSYAQGLIGKNSSARQLMKKAVGQLQELVNNINDLLGQMEKPEVVTQISELVNHGSFGNWAMNILRLNGAQKKINIAKEVGRKISETLSVVMEVIKQGESHIGATCRAIDDQILLRNKRADNKDVQDLKARREKDANIEAQHQANANADENAAQRGEDPYGDSIG